MDVFNFHSVLLYIQHSISFCGVLVIFGGVITALVRYVTFLFDNETVEKMTINKIRLKLGLVLTLGLEFIVAADLIGTTTAPDYYSIGIVASIVLIRTVLSYTLNHEINSIREIEKQDLSNAQNIPH
ncbi:MAG: DUF1622 domain-containing protein [Legionella sp.]|nr:DUF1622 domain-containing protein [Legionella sp.]